GLNVDDLELATIPVTRFQVRTGRSQGGVSVRLVPGDPQSVVIRFLDAEGLDIDEGAQRKIERLYYREDYRRVLAPEIGDIGFPPRALEFYTAALIESVDVDAIRGARFKLVLDYAYGSTSFVMPNVLAKLGTDVLAVNPYASTAGAVSFNPQSHAAGVADLVRAAGAHVGAVLDPDGERIKLIDDTGHVLSDDEAMFAVLNLVLATQSAPAVALPASIPRAAEALCRDVGASLEWTKLSPSHLMEVAASGGPTFAASQDGGFIFPAFLPAFDAVVTLVDVMAMLAVTGLRLSKLVAGTPRFHIAHETVVTPWEQKGLVMRTLVEQSKDQDLLLVDGVKVLYDDGWALVLPDPEDPVTHVWAEADGARDATTRAQDYARRIRQMLR
ncbi:MAG TPA: hypothetical protein VGR90_01170, partial [Acidimicrobiales bacterium]|nr:hypothetical protein [Acidimicrobiales bacterium]